LTVSRRYHLKVLVVDDNIKGVKGNASHLVNIIQGVPKILHKYKESVPHTKE